MPNVMRNVLPAIALCLAAMMAARPSSADGNAPDPLALYGAEARYEIFRDGEAIGHHHVSFGNSGEKVIARSRSDIRIPFLFVTAYRLDYDALTSWEDGRLVSLQAITDDDGDIFEVTAKENAGELLISGSAGIIRASPGIMPTEHWSMGVIGQNQLLNTITGALNEVEIVPLGVAFVPAGSGIVEAERYLIKGDLALETWYARSGRWLGMRFLGKDGSTIEYRCWDCGSTVATTE